MSDVILNPTRDSMQDDPAMAVLRNGRIVTAFTDLELDPGVDGGFGAYFTISSGDMRYRETGSIRVAQTTEGFQGNTRITALADGGFAVGWDGDNSADPYLNGYLRLFNANGTARTPEMRLSPSFTGDQRLQDVAQLESGVVVSVVARATVGQIYDLYTYRHDAQGRQIGNAVRIQQDVELGGVFPGIRLTPRAEIAPAADGSYAVAWYAYGDWDVSTDYQIFVQVFNASGTARGPARSVFGFDETGFDNDYPKITALSRGGYAIAWDRERDDDDLDQVDVFFRLLDANGRPRTTAIVANSGDTADEQLLADVIDLGGGMTLVTWQSARPDIGEFYEDYAVLMGRIMRADGRPAGPAFQISEFAHAESAGGNSALLPDGRLASVWEAEASYEFDEDVIGRVIAPHMPDLRGTSRADTIGGTHLSDRMIGGTGNDTLVGHGGNDSLFGGSGNDALVGGAGNDRIYASTGNDRVAADSGNDFVAGGAGNDLIRGGSGNDRLLGEAGNDTLEGGLGLDIMSGGSGRDVFVFTDPSESRRSGRDQILDFKRGEDRIDLRQIDDLTFRGTAALTGDGPELQILAVSGGRRVRIDSDGDGIADMFIEVRGVTALGATDFLL